MSKPIKPMLFVDVDIGNSLVKMKIHGLLNNLTVFPHALKFLDDAKWSIKKRLPVTSSSRNTKVIRVNGIAASIGARAEADGRLDRLTGEAKFRRDYYGMLFASGMLDILPDGHDNLHVFAGYSPLDVNAVDDLSDSLGGRHEIELLDGSKVVYNVRSVRTYQEPVGGLMNWLLQEGNENISPGRVLVIDIGGKISSLVPSTTDGDLDEPRGIDLGIQDILDDLERLLKANHRPFFRGLKTLPEDRRKEALQTGFYRGGGEELDVSMEVETCIGSLLNRIESHYINDFGGPRNFDYIVITGGGGGLLAEVLNTHVLNHRAVYLAEDYQNMHLANLHGAEKMLKLQLTHEAQGMQRRFDMRKSRR